MIECLERMGQLWETRNLENETVGRSVKGRGISIICKEINVEIERMERKSKERKGRRMVLNYILAFGQYFNIFEVSVRIKGRYVSW